MERLADTGPEFFGLSPSSLHLSWSSQLQRQLLQQASAQTLCSIQLLVEVSAPWQVLNKGMVEGLFLQEGHDWFKPFRCGDSTEPSSGSYSPRVALWAARPGQSCLETCKTPTRATLLCEAQGEPFLRVPLHGHSSPRASQRPEVLSPAWGGPAGILSKVGKKAPVAAPCVVAGLEQNQKHFFLRWPCFSPVSVILC